MASKPGWARGQVALLSVVMVACAVQAVGPAGSPSGGEYCFEEQGKPKACYETEGARAVAVQQRESEIRREREAAMFPAGETKQQKFWREEEERKAAEAKERDRVYADREEKRRAEADAAAARAAQLKALAADRAVAVPAISAIMCSIDEELTKLRADLAREKRITGVSGVINLRERDDLAHDIVADSDELAGWQRALTRFGAKRMACADVAAIVGCRNRLEQCEPGARDAAEVWAKEQATLWASEQERPQR
jgi:hypothetical protein